VDGEGRAADRSRVALPRPGRVMKRETRNNPEKAKPKKKAQERGRRCGRRSRRRCGSGRELSAAVLHRADRRRARRAREVRVKAFTKIRSALWATGRSKPRTASVSRSRRCGPRRDMLVAAAEGRDGSQRCRGIEEHRSMWRARNCRRPADDEFYHADLVGLAAVKADGEAIGTVKAVHISARAICWRSSRWPAVPR